MYAFLWFFFFVFFFFLFRYKILIITISFRWFFMYLQAWLISHQQHAFFFNIFVLKFHLGKWNDFSSFQSEGNKTLDLFDIEMNDMKGDSGEKRKKDKIKMTRDCLNFQVPRIIFSEVYLCQFLLLF